MGLLHSSKEYLFQLYAMNSGDARRIWKQDIKNEWNHKCAYCGIEEKLTIDHIIPQSKGGLDITKNVVCCCKSCNQNKGHTPWEDWYFSQEFFDMKRYEKIKQWMKPEPPIDLFSYRPIRNVVN